MICYNIATLAEVAKVVTAGALEKTISPGEYGATQ